MSNRITMIVNNEYIQWKDGDRILYDSRWTYEEFLNGGKDMDKEQFLKDIRETIDYNKAARCAENLSLYKDASRRSNEILARVVHHIRNTDEYERGANDAWELAKRIAVAIDRGGYTPIELNDIFNTPSHNVIFETLTATEALEKVKAYEKKKEEEAAKPKLGDVVEVISNRDGFIEKGIFLSECFDTITYIIADGGVVKVSSNHFKLIKTGEHVDIHGMLDKIG